jgi:enolase
MTNSLIRQVRGFRVWDSRGRPTVEAEVELHDGSLGRGIAPAGASRGSNEALELRDGGTADGGFGVSAAVGKLNGAIGAALAGMDAADQAAVDRRLIELDGTANMANLGGNSTVAASMAVLNAAARSHGIPVWRYLSGGSPVRMPLPEVQIFGGGAHAGRRTDIQDFLVMPIGAQSFDEALSMCAAVYRAAGELMERRGSRCGVADEGGWWPVFDSNEDALAALATSIDAAGYRNGEVMISLDLAASEFGTAGRYRLALEGTTHDTGDWLEILRTWIGRYPILSVEDPVAEDDLEGMRAFTASMAGRIQIIGDDFLVTNAERVAAAITNGCCNAVIIKPNQAGTITQALAALQCARQAGWGTIVSARSGESEDSLISHLAVGWDAGQLKVGSFARSERMAKWNECLRIERGERPMHPFAGRGALPLSAR